ncbi:MAG: response regulator [Fuerstiella sp.]
MTDPLIYLVDDDQAVAESLTVLLESDDYQVRVHSSGEQFLADEERHHASVLILDVKLNGIDGLELLRRLRTEQGFAPPVVMISGHADGESRQRAFDLGAVAFLSKPFSGDQLLNTIQSALAGH